MSAKAVLVAKANSHPFDDRALILDVPTKIGRSHKDDQAESGNGFFDCKVLSRQHAILMYEDDKFYLMDTGSSNGSFVNNIRLSKSGEESKLTRIYTNDVLRFGSDVVDKQRQITQKCVVMKVRLFYPDGPEVESRPSESRLFRPNDSMEDLSALTQTLQESLSREKHLEDKMIRIRGMISKNIGKTHTDLLRLFENMKQELMNNELNFSKGINTELEAYQKIMSENVELHRRASEQDKVLQEFRHANESLSNQQQSDKIEITSLRKTCQLQKQSIDSLEKELHNVHDELHHNRLESDERYNNKIRDMEQSKKELMEHYEQEITKNEDAFMEERTKIREQLLEVTRNEANLLNRIRCLESEEQYSHAEVEKVLIREREAQESRQKLDIQVEQLKNQLDQAETALEEQKSKIVIQRSEEDIEQIAKLEDHIGKLQHDIAYLKQELLEARARKSASDDELRTIKDKLETLENSITSLTNEGLRHRKQISELNEALEEKSKEADHWEKLVGEMESSLSQDEMTRVQIQDLRDELHGAERNLKLRQDDLLYLKNGIKSRDETIQQLEIDLSCVRGQVQNVEEELQITKDETSYVTNIKDENAQLKQRLVDLQDEFNYAQDHANHLTDELARQQILYSELKKMRGRGEEIDQIHEYKQELKALYERLSDMEQRDHHQRKQIQTLEQDRLEMTAEVTETRRLLARNPHLSPAEAAMHTVGNLKVYELILGLLFLFVLFTYGIF
ncbi:sarcolemmal membrane-associated protein-like isoform X2 [Tigriopus californicus]|uniref:sarcolemmal membrane-associated protein-like isoform X2 n=1 Tax=Tigriopus californicus TaxID=6832 RepID=UPI0027DAAD36|nr:sarcolemmal membrane-associated protein-like isoform X2 [Tigriopus californicus]